MINALKVYITLLLVIALPAQAEIIVGKAVGIADGDTITVLTTKNESVRVRLAGIDAPEKGQPFGHAAKEHLAASVFEKNVEIHYKKYDRYGRVVGKVVLDGIDICLKQIRDGFAWHFKKYVAEQEPADQLLYAESEKLARKERLGLWDDASPIAPWDHRSTKRQLKK